MRRFSRDEGGFTLAEVIVAVAILSMVFLFFLTLMAQVLVVTAKVQTRDRAMAIAQSKLEEIRNTLIVPSEPNPIIDKKWPGYSITVTSTQFLNTGAPGTSTYVLFLRNVTVTVSGPYGAVHLQTNIQTYRPQISFFLPVSNLVYISNKATVFEGLIRDDGYAITKVQYRTRLTATGTWGNWENLDGLYLDANRLSKTTTPLQVGKAYFFTIPILGKLGTGADGNIEEIQVQAENSGFYFNEQPAIPYGGTSYVRLVTDKTKPTATVELIPTTSITTGSMPVYTVTASDATSGVNNVFALISKTPSGGAKTYLHGSPGTTPHWASDIYYNTTTASDPQYYFADWLPGTLVYEPWTEYSFQAYVLDNVIGEYYDYLNLIPSQTVSPSGDTLWPHVTANFYQTATITRMMHPSPELTVTTSAATTITTTTAILRGFVNPGGLDSSVWFEYKTLSPSAWIATATSSMNGVDQIGFVQDVVNLLPATGYEFRAGVQNDWGTYYGASVFFTTLTSTQ